MLHCGSDAFNIIFQTKFLVAPLWSITIHSCFVAICDHSTQNFPYSGKHFILSLMLF